MKAANVLITRSGILKLADFGLARAFSLNKNNQPNRYIIIVFVHSIISTLLILKICVYCIDTRIVSSHCGTALQNCCSEKEITALLLICGVQGASWQRCGREVPSCR